MKIEDFEDLRVYKSSFEAAMELFELSKNWPEQEKYALTDQIRRSSRAVCSNISEAWFKRGYPRHFASKLSDASSEAAETITWLRFAERCKYLDGERAHSLEATYRKIIGGLVKMILSEKNGATVQPYTKTPSSTKLIHSFSSGVPIFILSHLPTLRTT